MHTTQHDMGIPHTSGGASAGGAGPLPTHAPAAFVVVPRLSRLRGRLARRSLCQKHTSVAVRRAHSGGLSRSRVLLRTTAAAVAPKSTRARTGFPAPESWTGRSMTGSTCRGIVHALHISHMQLCMQSVHSEARMPHSDLWIWEIGSWGSGLLG